MSQLTRDYKGAGRRNLRPGGMKEFALGALAGALLAGGIAALVAAQGHHRQAGSSPACTAAGGTQSPGKASTGAGPAAAAPGARSAATASSHTASGGNAGGTAAPAAGHTAVSPAQHYDFYQMLPRQTVPVPAKSSAAQARSPAAAPAHPAASPGYLLQVGSYSTDAQARQVLERLTHMGLSAQIQRVTERGRALERVRVGPVDSAGLARIRRKLATAGFHPLVIPTRHD